MCTIASVLPCSRAAHIAQCEVCNGEASLGPLAIVLGEVSSPHLVESKSVIVDVRATLQGEALSRVQDMALVWKRHPLNIDGVYCMTYPQPLMDAVHKISSVWAALVGSRTWPCHTCPSGETGKGMAL